VQTLKTVKLKGRITQIMCKRNVIQKRQGQTGSSNRPSWLCRQTETQQWRN